MKAPANRVEPLSGLRVAAVLVAVVAGIALLGLASRGLPSGSHGKSVRPVSAGHAFDYVLALAVTAWALGVVYGFVQLFLVRRRRRRRRPVPSNRELWTPDLSRHWGAVLVALVLVLFAIPIVVAYFVRPGGSTFARLPTPLGSMLHGLDPRGLGTVGSTLRWSLPISIALLLVMLFMAARNERLIRRRNPLRRRESLAGELVGALDESLDDIEAEPDPRHAVIRSYARMERVLDSHGLPRESFEAPFEYLARVLQEVHASGPGARRLTELYERARFSTHRIDTSMKGHALDAVRALRAELETAR
jgi:hypothetical protein